MTWGNVGGFRECVSKLRARAGLRLCLCLVMFGGGVSCPCALLGNRNSAVNMMGGGMQAIHMVDSNVQDTSTDYRIGGRRGGDEAKKVKRDQDEEFNFSGT